MKSKYVFIVVMLLSVSLLSAQSHLVKNLQSGRT